MHVVRERKVPANDLYRTVMVSGLFQMRTPESKAFVEGSALAQAQRLTAQMNYRDNVSVHLLPAERQWGLDFTCLFRPLALTDAPFAPVNGRVVSTL